MNAQELRIGNWVIINQYGRKYIEQVESIFYANYGRIINIHAEASAYGYASIEGTDISDVEGILLTPKLIYHLGFNNYFDGTLDWSDGKWHIDDFVIELLHGHYLVRLRKSVEITYLHQLQNLYFAITGQELIYKP